MSSTCVWLGLYIASLGADVCWAMWTMETNRQHAVRAGLWSAGIALFGIIFFSGYLANRWNVVPVAMGAFTGTMVTVLHRKRRDRR